MLERVAATIARYHMLEPGQRVGIAVSGGVDSVCLFEVLCLLAPRWDLHLAVLHLDHQLRGEESRRDAAFVAELASRKRLPFHTARVVLDSFDNLEQAAREARRTFFRSTMERERLERVALGHTRSDQAETVLFRFLRGSGTAGLAGIRPVSSDGFIRPLISLDRQEVESYMRSHGIAWREDSTNSSLRFARNRIRHELLPQLTRDWNPQLVSGLVHTAECAFDEEAYWEGEIGRLAGLYLRAKPPAVLLRADRLAALPRAVARRLVRRAIERAKGDLRALEFEHVEQVLQLAEHSSGSGRFQAPGLDIFRSFDWIRIAPPAANPFKDRNFEIPLPIPGDVDLPGECIRLRLEAFPPNSGYTGRMSDLDWERVSGPLHLRNWRPGDQYQPRGSDRPEKLKTMFQQGRVPLWDRRHWPVIARDDDILWARRFGPASHAAATASSRMLLRIQEIDNVES